MKIKINFCDMASDFNKEDNYFTQIINRHFEGYEISDEPDFLVYSVFGTTHLKYTGCVKAIRGKPAGQALWEWTY